MHCIFRAVHSAKSTSIQALCGARPSSTRFQNHVSDPAPRLTTWHSPPVSYTKQMDTMKQKRQQKKNLSPWEPLTLEGPSASIDAIAPLH
jgi:hypothetical protein